MATFPTTNDDSNNYYNIVDPYINVNSARLTVSAANLTVLNTFYDNGGVAQNDLGWMQLWVLYSNEDTSTTTIKGLVRVRREQMNTALRTIYDDIPESFLTANDRTTFRIPDPNAASNPVPILTFPPDVDVESSSNGVQILRFSNPQTPDSDAMPPNQVVEVQTFIGAPNLPDNSVPFVVLRDSSKHLLTVTYTPDQKGQTAYYRALYKNPKGETGPWSDVESEIIL